MQGCPGRGQNRPRHAPYAVLVGGPLPVAVSVAGGQRAGTRRSGGLSSGAVHSLKQQIGFGMDSVHVISGVLGPLLHVPGRMTHEVAHGGRSND